MNSYDKKLIKYDLNNIKHWVENTEWKKIKKLLYTTILKNNYNLKLITSNSNNDVYQSINRLSSILDSGELVQLLKDLNKLFYLKKQNKNNCEMIGGNNVLSGGLNMGKFANKLKSSASTYAKKAKSHVVEQGNQMAQQAKQYAQEQSQQMIQQAKQYAQQQAQQMAQQGQQMAQQAQQYAQQQAQQLAQQTQQYVQQQGQQLAQQGQQYLQDQAKLAQQQLQNTFQQVGHKVQQVGNQLNKQAQMYLTPQYQPQVQQIQQMPIPQQLPTPQQMPIPQQIMPSGYIQPPLPLVPVQQLSTEQPAEPQRESSSGFFGSFFESAGDIGKKLVGL